LDFYFYLSPCLPLSIPPKAGERGTKGVRFKVFILSGSSPAKSGIATRPTSPSISPSPQMWRGIHPEGDKGDEV